MKNFLEIDPPGATHRLGKTVAKNEGTDNKIRKCTDHTKRNVQIIK